MNSPNVAVPPVNIPNSYMGRVKASWWSKAVLLFAAIISLLIFPFDLGIAGLIVTVGICAVTYFEFRVNRYFSEGNEKAPTLGFRNQSLFALGILIYGLYHAFFPSTLEVPSEYQDVIDETTMEIIKSTLKIGYLLIGAVGGISQFCLAWYYRNAR